MVLTTGAEISFARFQRIRNSKLFEYFTDPRRNLTKRSKYYCDISRPSGAAAQQPLDSPGDLHHFVLRRPPPQFPGNRATRESPRAASFNWAGWRNTCRAKKSIAGAPSTRGANSRMTSFGWCRFSSAMVVAVFAKRSARGGSDAHGLVCAGSNESGIGRKRNVKLVRVLGEQSQNIVLRAREIGEAVDDDQLQLGNRLQRFRGKRIAGGPQRTFGVTQSVRRQNRLIISVEQREFSMLSANSRDRHALAYAVGRMSRRLSSRMCSATRPINPACLAALAKNLELAFLRSAIDRRDEAIRAARLLMRRTPTRLTNDSRGKLIEREDVRTQTSIQPVDQLSAHQTAPLDRWEPAKAPGRDFPSGGIEAQSR